jgi:CDP-diglyceride synthetase
MIRNNHVNELPIYGYIIWWPCMFLMPIIFHFTCSYLNQPRKWRTIILWAVCAIFFILGVAGLSGKIVGVYDYSWGHIYKPDHQLLMSNLIGAPFLYFFGFSALWYLFRAYKQESSPLKKRHILYIFISLLIVHLATAKVSILYDFDVAFLMPTCMLLNDIAAALIGIAIIKHGLFDITVVVKKTTIYSALAAIIVLVFSLSEHLLATYVSGIFGEQSAYIHIISVAVVIGIVMPVRKRVENGIERFFAKKKVEF